MEDKKQKTLLRDRRTGFFWISHTLKSYNLSWRALLAYMAIAAQVRSDTSTCRCTMMDLARFCGVSESTMKRGVGELVKKQAIKIKHRKHKLPGGQSEQLPSEYILTDLTPQPLVSSLPAK